MNEEYALENEMLVISETKIQEIKISEEQLDQQIAGTTNTINALQDKLDLLNARKTALLELKED